jgi:hypothetical protein
MTIESSATGELGCDGLLVVPCHSKRLSGSDGDGLRESVDLFALVLGDEPDHHVSTPTSAYDSIIFATDIGAPNGLFALVSGRVTNDIIYARDIHSDPIQSTLIPIHRNTAISRTSCPVS